VQRWRILHAGWQDDIFMELEVHTLHPIARDGNPLSRMGQSILRTPEHAKDDPKAMLMAPGQRIDVLVKAGAPGSYMFRAVPYNQGYSSPIGPIARIVVEGDPLSMKLPTKLPPPPEKTIANKEITGTRVLRVSATHPEVEATEHWQEFRSTARFSIQIGSINECASARWKNGRSSMSTRTTTSSTSTPMICK
jgi:FtsP/CotA-like multicopper oxidase with cupredoxin domain